MGGSYTVARSRSDGGSAAAALLHAPRRLCLRDGAVHLVWQHRPLRPQLLHCVALLQVHCDGLPLSRSKPLQLLRSHPRWRPRDLGMS